jgi:predicted chitinase
MQELGDPRYFLRYDPRVDPAKARVLGNVKPGDGERYKGRGFIQITGRDNYRRAGEALGLPLEDRPELAARMDVAARIAVWYWKQRVKPNVSNFNDTRAVTRQINPNMRGLEDRHENFKDYKKVFSMNWKAV